jgi:hypothetical protein
MDADHVTHADHYCKHKPGDEPFLREPLNTVRQTVSAKSTLELPTVFVQVKEQKPSDQRLTSRYLKRKCFR